MNIKDIRKAHFRNTSLILRPFSLHKPGAFYKFFIFVKYRSISYLVGNLPDSRSSNLRERGSCFTIYNIYYLISLNGIRHWNNSSSSVIPSKHEAFFRIFYIGHFVYTFMCYILVLALFYKHLWVLTYIQNFASAIYKWPPLYDWNIAMRKTLSNQSINKWWYRCFEKSSRLVKAKSMCFVYVPAWQYFIAWCIDCLNSSW